MCECNPSFAQLFLQVNRNKIFLNYWISLPQKSWSFTIFLSAVTARLNCIILVSVRNIFAHTNTYTHIHTHIYFGRSYHAVSSVSLMQYSLNLWRKRKYEKYFKSYALYTPVVWDLKAESATIHFPGSNFACQKKYTVTLWVHVYKH